MLAFTRVRYIAQDEEEQEPCHQMCVFSAILQCYQNTSEELQIP